MIWESTCTHLLSQSLYWGDKDASGVGCGREHSQDGKFGTDGLAATSRRSHEDIFIRVVEGIEDLGLYGVKIRELVAVESLVGGVSEGGDWEGLQV